MGIDELAIGNPSQGSVTGQPCQQSHDHQKDEQWPDADPGPHRHVGPEELDGLQSAQERRGEERPTITEVARRAGFLTRGADDMTVLETTMAVDEASFSATSAMMQTWAAAFQLDYDGWECAVVTN